MYRHRIIEIKALGKCKSCHWSLYSPAGIPVKPCSAHKCKAIFPWPSGQAQKEYLKHCRTKRKTANSIARLHLELLKNLPILINYFYANNKKYAYQSFKAAIFLIYISGLSYTSLVLVQMILPKRVFTDKEK